MPKKMKKVESKRKPRFLPKESREEIKPEVDEDKIIILVRRLHEAKVERSFWEEESKNAQESIIDILDDLGKDRYRVDHWADRGLQAEVVRVQSHRTVIDEASLKKRLGAKTWEKVTTRTLDRAKLDALIKSGEIDPTDVAQATSEVANNPWVKVNEVRKRP